MLLKLGHSLLMYLPGLNSALFPLAPILLLRLLPLAVLLLPFAVLFRPFAFLGLTVLAQFLQNAIKAVFRLLPPRILPVRQIQNITTQIRIGTQQYGQPPFQSFRGVFDCHGFLPIPAPSFFATNERESTQIGRDRLVTIKGFLIHFRSFADNPGREYPY